jgi:hypothetical protein
MSHLRFLSFINFSVLNKTYLYPSGGKGSFQKSFSKDFLSSRRSRRNLRKPTVSAGQTNYFFLPLLLTGKVYPCFHPFPPVSPLYPLPSICSSHSRAAFSLLKVRTRLKPLGSRCCSFLWSRSFVSPTYLRLFSFPISFSYRNGNNTHF